MPNPPVEGYSSQDLVVWLREKHDFHEADPSKRFERNRRLTADGRMLDHMATLKRLGTDLDTLLGK